MTDQIDYERIARRLHSMVGIICHVTELDPGEIEIQQMSMMNDLVATHNLGQAFNEITQILYPNGFPTQPKH